jgi:hypothetical protein
MHPPSSGECLKNSIQRLQSARRRAEADDGQGFVGSAGDAGRGEGAPAFNFALRAAAVRVGREVRERSRVFFLFVIDPALIQFPVIAKHGFVPVDGIDHPHGSHQSAVAGSG